MICSNSIPVLLVKTSASFINLMTITRKVIPNADKITEMRLNGNMEQVVVEICLGLTIIIILSLMMVIQIYITYFHMIHRFHTVR